MQAPGTATRTVLLGARAAGKSRLFGEVAAASGVPIVTHGDVRSIVVVTTSGARFSLIDAPCDQVDSQITHETGVAILVVAGVDGPLPASRHQLEGARACGVRHLIGYLDDRAVEDNELVDLVELEIRELASNYEFGGDTLVVVRARGKPAAHVSGGVGALANALDALAMRGF